MKFKNQYKRAREKQKKVNLINIPGNFMKKKIRENNNTFQLNHKPYFWIWIHDSEW